MSSIKHSEHQTKRIPTRHVIWTSTIGTSLVIALVLLPHQVQSYQPTKTCRQANTITEETPTASPICENRQSGINIKRASQTVAFSIHNAGTKDISNEQDGTLSQPLMMAIRDALEQWNMPTCSNFTFTVSGTHDDASSPVDKRNDLAWITKDWPTTEASVALTLVTSTTSGELIDADILLNDQFFNWTLEPDGQDNTYDIKNTLVHEAGHALGLDHPAVTQASMYWQSAPEEISKRTLDDDDIQGLCATYPPLPSKPPSTDEGCCAQSPSKPPARATTFMVLCVMMGLFLRRRKYAEHV